MGSAFTSAAGAGNNSIALSTMASPYFALACFSCAPPIVTGVLVPSGAVLNPCAWSAISLKAFEGFVCIAVTSKADIVDVGFSSVINCKSSGFITGAAAGVSAAVTKSISKAAAVFGSVVTGFKDSSTLTLPV